MDDRLKTIMDFVPAGSKVADVGTDHAYLAVELVKRGIADFVIASDKNVGPIEAAKQSIAAAGLSDKIDVRLGDGLKVISAGEVEVVCIAGMGGSLVCDILSASPEVVARLDKIILQPMNAVDKVRGWLISNDWYIEDEDLAEVDGIIYEIICAGKSAGNVVSSTRKVRSPLFPKFIQSNVDKLSRILEAMSQSPAAVHSDKYRQIQRQIDEWKAF